ncbi:ribonuclease H family protein [Enterococcus sp.]|uniref:ribonuclease H family protein n=1 Tax=Enterococcus sp. TaxID=35783 RepID=UPI00290EFF8A|nr:ribonuclease H family protein [Enterococcus sp.]MDU5335603.1 ribonuclease H family protein [Enterococcus sp.]
MAKFYAVKVGRKTGVFTTWNETNNLVKGYPNAKFKSFTSEAAANEYLQDKAEVVASFDEGYSAFVDGSFNKGKQQYGSGVVILKDGTVIDELSITGTPDFIESYQIAGETIATLEAIRWAVDHKVDKISIHYDYQGIESWAKGDWKTNKPISEYYKKEFDLLSTKTNVSFVKVKGHSGDKYNDRADYLAGKAADA